MYNKIAVTDIGAVVATCQAEEGVEAGKLVKISELDMGYVNNQGQTLKTSELTERQHRNMAEF